MTTTTTLNDPLIRTATRALTNRPRRLRRTESIRSLVRETVVRPEDLIYPLFVVPNRGRDVRRSARCRACWQLRVREAVDEARRAYDAGVRAVLLFGLPEYEGRASGRRRGIRAGRCSRRSRRSSAPCRR